MQPVIFGDSALYRTAYSNLFSAALKFSRSRDPAIMEIGIHTGDNSGWRQPK